MTTTHTGPLELSALAGDPAARLDQINLVATDVDGTLTRSGALVDETLAAIERLVMAGIEVVPVSGRPAGEVLGLCRYLPGVRRGIAENGLISIVPDQAPEFIGVPTDVARLRAVGDHLNAAHGAGLRLAGDAFCRLGDVAYERDGRDVEALSRLQDVAAGQGVHLVWSNVHVHLAERIPDKGEGLLTMLERWGVSPSSVATIGDAPNDAGLFTAGRFGLTVGTADVRRQLSVMPHLPTYAAASAELDGFLELVEVLLLARGAQPSTH